MYQCTVRVCIQTNLEVIRRKHTTYHTGFGACSSTCNKRWRQMYRHHRSNRSPTLQVHVRVSWCQIVLMEGNHKSSTSNGSWCMGIKGEMSGTVCVIFTWDMYIYIWVVYSLCFFCCLFIIVTWWYVWCIEWASGNQEEVQACLVTVWLFIISCYSLYKTTLGLLCSWFVNNPHFHKYSMDFHV